VALGSEPTLPFDIVESTWLVKLPNRILTTEELIGFRAQALSKHKSFVMDMMDRVDETKRRNLRVFEIKYRHTIKDWDFKPGTLVQMRNSTIEKNLDRKMYPRYKGPLVVIRRSKGGAYILAEMDGTVLREKVAAFRVLPHVARYEPIDLPEDITKLIDINTEQLESMVNDDEESYGGLGPDYPFDAIPNLRLEDNNEEDAVDSQEKDI
jgi:hypothetical protein